MCIPASGRWAISSDDYVAAAVKNVEKIFAYLDISLTKGYSQIPTLVHVGDFFNLQQTSGDRLLVIATPGWITGQSYMISAPLLCCMPSVLLDGAPLSPQNLFTATMQHRGTSTSTELGRKLGRPYGTGPHYRARSEDGRDGYRPAGSAHSTCST